MTDTPLTLEEIAELEKLEDAATEGPWTKDSGGQRVDSQEFGVHPIGWITTSFNAQNDQAFIAAARNALPALLTEIKRNREAEEAAYERGVRAAQKPYSHFDFGMECG